MRKSQNRVVLLGDVVGSRSIASRKKFEARFTAAVQKAVQQHDVWELPLRAWKGLDEVAAVLKKPWLIYPLISSLQDDLAPEQMRFVMVQDVLDILPASGDVTQADGPAFHKAAALMTELKSTGLLFACATGDQLRDKALATQLNLLLLVKKGWTERQRRIFGNYWATGRQEEVARQLKVTQQSVSKTLRSVDAFAVRRLEEDFVAWCTETMNR